MVAGASKHQLTSAVMPVRDLEIEALEDGIASIDEENSAGVVVATMSCDEIHETFEVDQLQEHFADSDHDDNRFNFNLRLDLRQK